MAQIESTIIKSAVVKNLYRDSVALMQLSARINGMEGIEQASAIVASDANLELLSGSGLLSDTLGAGPSDVLIAVEGINVGAAENALEMAKSLLLDTQEISGSSGVEEKPPTSIAVAANMREGANLALISTPGDYAAAEARKALKLGLNVMMFSDNVAEADELSLKQYGSDHGLLVMGPDCGTAIINGIPLGFANVVRRGAIGVIAASGTGLQQVTSLIDQSGLGVSQAIGTGGHDLHEHIGGITMLQAFADLEEDPATEVIVLVSKPPAPSVADKIVRAATTSKKPVVINFLSQDAREGREGSVQSVETLADAAAAAVLLARGKDFVGDHSIGQSIAKELAARSRKLGSGRYVRGLYSGGTFCYEALIIISGAVGPVYSNIAIDSEYSLPDIWVSKEHCVVDLGDDDFTRGRPHPMIDHRLRNERIVAEASDPETAVILLDIVLGYGSHDDPAAEMAPAIAEALSSAEGRDLVFIGSVCGTQGDPQGLDRQRQALKESGVLLADSNAQAARWAAEIVRGDS